MNLNPTTPRIYRAGVIGLGSIGAIMPDNHVDAYKNCERTELVATCDINGSLKPNYQRFMDMVVDQHLDIVSVCTPFENHHDIVCHIAKWVKAIYCEKPMAETLEECDRMIDFCKRSHTILQINHQRRFTNPVIRFSGDILSNGSHALDLMNWLFESRPEIKVDVEYTPEEDGLFELDVCHNYEPMIQKGVEHLVHCLDTGEPTVSSGKDGKKALDLVLKFMEVHNE